MVADITSWGYYPYGWLSDHQAVFFRWPLPEGVFLYDIRTHKETPLPVITRELQKPNFGANVDYIRISPDGTRLLWMKYDIEPVEGAWLDGSHRFASFPRRPNSNTWMSMYWTNDSRHWVAFITDRQSQEVIEAVVYDDDPSHKPRTVVIAVAGQPNPFEGLDLGAVQMCIFNDHLLTWAGTDMVHMTPTVDILDIGLGTRIGSPQKRRITLPTSSVIQEMEFSPGGDRIAWHLRRQEIPIGILFLKRWVPQLHIADSRRESLWVSDIDGANMHEIGSLDLKSGDQFAPRIGRLEWVPGGKRLAFRYHDALYTVSAE